MTRTQSPKMPEVITDPLGAHWNQPRLNQIEFHDNFAIMTKESFDRLMEYSHSNPTGTYTGKMWKAKIRGRWYLEWYGKFINEGLEILIHRKKILVHQKIYN